MMNKPELNNHFLWKDIKIKGRFTTLLIIFFLTVPGLNAQDNKNRILFYRIPFYTTVPQIKQNRNNFHNRNIYRLQPVIAKSTINTHNFFDIRIRSKFNGNDSLNTNQEEIRMRSWNLALRGLLELSGLIAMGHWGFEKGDGASRYALMIGVPLLAAATWGTFAVEGDPSRSGTTVIPTPGIVRLGLELGFFAFSTWAIQDVGSKPLAWGFGSTVIFHYAISYKRILWLLNQ